MKKIHSIVPERTFGEIDGNVGENNWISENGRLKVNIDWLCLRACLLKDMMYD